MGPAIPEYVKESRAAAEKALTGVLDPKWSAVHNVIQAVVERDRRKPRSCNTPANITST